MALGSHRLRQVRDAGAANELAEALRASLLEPSGAALAARPHSRGTTAPVGVHKTTAIIRPRQVSADAPEASDQELVARVLRGDLDAFAAILARHQHRVYSIAANFAANSDDASDLAQEVFLKAYRSLRHFRGQSAFSTWLYRIAVNACVDYTRRQARSSCLPLADDLLSAPDEPGLDPQQELERKELRTELLRAISGLSMKLRVTLVLHDIEGLTHEEIARVVSCSVGTTKSRLFRAREEVRRRLREQREGEGK
jgi:RNA polymerase sigma-70 factor (ECF subfamily)